MSATKPIPQPATHQLALGYPMWGALKTLTATFGDAEHRGPMTIKVPLRTKSGVFTIPVGEDEEGNPAILLHQRNAKGTYPLWWNCYGGGVKGNESCVYDALNTEVKEESGEAALEEVLGMLGRPLYAEIQGWKGDVVNDTPAVTANPDAEPKIEGRPRQLDLWPLEVDVATVYVVKLAGKPIQTEEALTWGWLSYEKLVGLRDKVVGYTTATEKVPDPDGAPGATKSVPIMVEKAGVMVPKVNPLGRTAIFAFLGISVAQKPHYHGPVTPELKSKLDYHFVIGPDFCLIDDDRYIARTQRGGDGSRVVTIWRTLGPEGYMPGAIG